jgi:hypothetical protein
MADTRDNGKHVCYSCRKVFHPSLTIPAHRRWRVHLMNNHAGKNISTICHDACDGIHTEEATFAP